MKMGCLSIELLSCKTTLLSVHKKFVHGHVQWSTNFPSQASSESSFMFQLWNSHYLERSQTGFAQEECHHSFNFTRRGTYLSSKKWDSTYNVMRVITTNEEFKMLEPSNFLIFRLLPIVAVQHAMQKTYQLSLCLWKTQHSWPAKCLWKIHKHLKWPGRQDHLGCQCLARLRTNCRVRLFVMMLLVHQLTTEASLLWSYLSPVPQDALPSMKSWLTVLLIEEAHPFIQPDLWPCLQTQ